jgi:hypothetical protein
VVPVHQPIKTHPPFETADVRVACARKQLSLKVLTEAGPFYVRNNKRGTCASRIVMC